MKVVEKLSAGLALIMMCIGIASVESRSIVLPLIMIIGGGLWLVILANKYSWD